MKAISSFLLCALLGWAPHLTAQFVNEAGDVRVLVPKMPLVKTSISKLLLLGSRESDSLLALKSLHAELSRQTAFQAVLPEENSPLAAGVESVEGLTKEQRDGIAAKYGASHVMWFRLERFNFKEKRSTEVIKTPAGSVYQHKWLGVATALLQCPVMDVATGALTTLAPQNINKQYHRENEMAQPVGENTSTVRMEVYQMAARRALQMVVTVQAVQYLPFMTQGALGSVHTTLKAGKLDDALAQATALAAGSGTESAKFQARIQYDLGLLLCLKNRPAEALVALEAAQKAGFDKTEVQNALEACKSIRAAQALSPR